MRCGVELVDTESTRLRERPGRGYREEEEAMGQVRAGHPGRRH